MPACAIERCARPLHARGWCHNHYEQWRRTGRSPRMLDTPRDRFLLQTSRAVDGCLLWTGALTTGPGRGEGYGSFRLDGRQIGAHRAAWLLFVGPIPDGLTIDHACHNEALRVGRCAGGPCTHRRCVEWTHLRAVPIGENLLAGDTVNAKAAARTSCIRGHPLTGDNLYVQSSTAKRQCRRCARERQYAYRRGLKL